MTIVAWDGKTVSVDSMLTFRNCGSTHSAQKIYRLIKPIIGKDTKGGPDTIITAVTGAGNWQSLSKMVAIFNRGAEAGDTVGKVLRLIRENSTTVIEQLNFQFFLVGTEGGKPVMMRVMNNGVRYLNPFESEGSGSVPVGRLGKVFKDSIEMVVTACTLDKDCGYEVLTYDPVKDSFKTTKSFSVAKRKALVKRIREEFEKKMELLLKPTPTSWLHKPVDNEEEWK